LAEAKKESFWIWLAVYVIILTVFAQFVSSFTGYATYSWNSDSSMGAEWDSPFPNSSLAPLIILFILSFLLPALSKKLDKESLVLLYVATVFAVVNAGYAGRYDVMSSSLNAITSKPQYDPIIPPWWMPDKDIVEPALLGGAPVPWGAWLPSLVTWSLVPIVVFLGMFAAISIVRRQWIEIEDIPFPTATAANQLVTLTLSGDEESALKKRVAFAGFIVSFLFFLPYILTPLFPWIPDPFGYRSYHKWHFGWAKARNIAPFLYNTFVALDRIDLHPLFIMLGLLAPITVLNSVVVGFLVRLLVPQALVAAGYPNVWRGTGVGKRWPLGLDISVPSMLLGVLIFWLIVNRRYVLNTLRAITGSAPPEFLEAEKKEAMSYRTAYIILIGAIVFMYIYTVSLGVRLDVAIPVVLGALFFAGIMRSMVYGYTGMGSEQNWGDLGTVYFAWFYTDPSTNAPYSWLIDPKKDPIAGRDFCWAAVLSNKWYRNANSIGWSWGWAFYAGDALRLAHLSGVDNKKVFKASLISMVISAIISPLMIIWIWYTFGAKVVGARMDGTMIAKESLGQLYAHPVSLRPISNVGGIWVSVPWLIGYALFAIVMMFLQAKFVWWPLNIFGFFIPWSRSGFKYGIDFMFLVAWVIKLIVLKIGGTKVYEKYIVPFVAGALGGYSLYIVFHNIACTARWFMGPV